MYPHKRSDVLSKQKRSYFIGNIDITGDQYVIYDDMNDELFLVEELEDYRLEIMSPKGWKTGRWLGFGKVKTEVGVFSLNCGDSVRVKKSLPLALDEMLKELPDETFVKVLKQLNSLSFSPFDCVYSYNQLLFMGNQASKRGVSFYQFDNEDSICSIQHHFERGIMRSDRFEFTTSLCKRGLVIAQY
ncbi:DUF2777 family protein [Metabacillus malikii]|uniref:DUF2777 domain-containing protein n=1 Tax=Metabacillus malikii TaxID=1504265 RepID=A0ABT9ZJ06_9BACI|nr:DUF2777 family protein [Metabacillus malikii]MDQ0232254.1 hypothetical protein [Metabacillus malikii]